MHVKNQGIQIFFLYMALTKSHISSHLTVQCTVHSTFLVIFSKHLAIRYIIRQFKIFYRIIVLSIAPWECFFLFSLFTRSYDNEQKNLKILIKTFLLSALILGWFFTDKYIHCRIVQVLNIVLNVPFSFSYLCDLFKIRDLKESKNGNCLFGSFRVYQNCQSFQVGEKVQDLPTLLYRIPLDRGAVAPDMGGPP